MRRLALILLLMGGMGAEAQQRPQRPAPEKASPPPAQPAPPPPPTGYEPLLLRLSEILGSVAYLSDLCGGPANPPRSDEFRKKMRELIDSEAQNELQRDRFAGAYNRGFVGYQTMHLKCTPVSRVALDRLIQEGARLSHEISARFGS